MSNIPYSGFNSYYTNEGMNSLLLNIIDPLGYFANFVVTIESPVFPSVSTVEEEQPDYLLSDFLLWCRPLKEYLKDEESSFYPLFIALSELAKERIRFTNVKSGTIWKRLVSMYVAHYMELTIQSWKDEANRLSLNPYDKEKDYKYDMVLGNTVFEEFKTTSWGRQFWHEYKPYGVFADGVWGVTL